MLKRLCTTCFLLLLQIATARAQVVPASAVSSQHSPAVSAVGGVSITVSDLDRAVEFYSKVLSFTQTSESEHAGDAFEHLTGVFGARSRSVTLRLGTESIELTQFLAAANGEGRPIPPDSRSNDRWFQHIAIVVSDMDKAYSHLRDHKVRHASSGPQTLPLSNPKAGGIAAFYFKDPDGHVLEVIHFPPGKGDPRWQRNAAPSQPRPLFLGIDHTAIVVADTDRSLAFYRDTLGMAVTGESENFGTEQEHLNNVFGARLRITALRAASGPGIELLEYLAPTDGRGYPPDSRANDLWSWHTMLVSPSTVELETTLREHHTTWVSPGVVSGISGSPAAAHIRDPDGHAIYLLSLSAIPAAGSASGGR